MVQYFYYTRKTLQAAPASSRSRSRTVHGQRASLDPTLHSSAHYRALSAVAANVASSAALAAHQDGTTPHMYRSRRSTDAIAETLAQAPDSERAEEEDEVDEETLTALADSFHSTRSRRGVRSWSKDRYTSPRIGTVQAFEPLQRGRAAQRPDGEEEGDVEEEEERSREESRRRRNSRASRMSASIVFMGAWALFGIGTLVSSRQGFPMETSLHIGRVLERPTTASYELTDTVSHISSAARQPDDALAMVNLSGYKDDVEEANEHHDEESPSMERIIGRIFAWACTTLYLTSRLPQIWKNVSILRRTAVRPY
jgi:solute carrier family 66 (lysosomal lysine-arginine transporter), member 1